jgi:ubiquinone/menaquinone biosynthesis C-methylase UbiE
VKERFYDRLNQGLDRKGFGEPRERLVADLAGDVLKVGAGTGLNMPHYRHAGRLIALEPDRHYLRRLRTRARQASVPVEIIETTAEALPFPDESFDHVVSSLVLC